MTPISYSLKGAAMATGLSTSYLERAIHAGRLKAKKSGEDKDGNPVGNWVILHVELDKFAAGLVDA